MNFLFLYPDYRENIGKKERTEFPPLGLLHICSILEQYKHNVTVLPFNLDTHKNQLPMADVLAYSITASSVFPYFTNILKHTNGKARFHIAGGVHSTYFPDKTISDMKLDACFIGEAEETIIKWASSPTQNVNKYYQDKETDVNDIPFPARHLLPEKSIYLNMRVGGKLDNVISMFASRGCPNRCKFCATPLIGKPRYRNPDNFCAEIDHILKNYPKCEGITLLDSNFPFSTTDSLKIAEILHMRRLPWECNARVDSLTTEVIEVFSKYGCKEVKVGIESGSKDLLNNMGKSLDLEKTKQKLRLCARYGLPVKAYIMHGFPNENMVTTNETINYLKVIKDYVQRVGLYRFTPLPGSQIYSSNKIHKMSWEKYTIYGNKNHWFGTIEQYQELENAFFKLEHFIKNNFNQ